MDSIPFRCDSDANNFRVLILTPQGRDAALAEQTLSRSGLVPHICEDLEYLGREIVIGAGAVLIAEETLVGKDVTPGAIVPPEPPWSSTPIIVLLGRSGRRDLTALHWLEHRPNVSFLERPVPKRTLVSTLRAAIEARRLQYIIRDALDAAETASRKKDEFLATLAHELRNPLAPIRNAIYVLRRLSEEDAPSREKAGSLVSMVERQVDHLVRLVDDLLEVSRIATGKIALKKRHVNLAKVIEHAIEICEPLIKSERHELLVSAADGQLIVDGDPVRLAQVFANLINNAAKYTPRGGHIEVSLRREQQTAIVSVRDNGMGILPGMLPLVFELFSQSYRARGRDQGGLGIGLALVRSLTELHEGRVEARSDGAGQGSEFIVRLPLADARSERAEVKSSPSIALASRRVLVVDDDKDVADSLVMLLESLGAEARVAYNGAEALSSLATFKPRVAFVDIGMPEMDGYDTGRAIRSAPHGKDIVLVALSGWGSDKDRQRTLEAGFNCHFVKPISFETLTSMFTADALDNPEFGRVCLQEGRVLP
jgi:signal transduction histidine kinase/CheY-like chemotaxis protein